MHTRSPGLVVMEGDSCPDGPGSESQYPILDGHFFSYICCKNCNFCLKGKNKQKIDLGWPIF